MRQSLQQMKSIIDSTLHGNSIALLNISVYFYICILSTMNQHRQLFLQICKSQCYISTSLLTYFKIIMQNSKNHQDLDRQLQTILQNTIQGKVQDQHLKEFGKSLFPIMHDNNNIYKGFYDAISTYYLIKANKNTFDQITIQFNKKCEEAGHGLPQVMKNLFETEFLQKFKLKHAFLKDTKNMQAQLNVTHAHHSKQQKQQRKINDLSKVNDVVIVGGSKPKQHIKQPNGSNKSANGKHEHKKHSNGNSEVDYVNNLFDRGVCLCEKQVNVQNQSTFVCTHCGYTYHLQCMKKKQGTKHCSMCHLRKMLPNKEVKKVLFMGVLKKSKKKHEFNIYLSDDDLSLKYKLQIRCFRLKEQTQYSVLFPDYTNIVLNNYSVKQFQPLHRQSSLKYRKDEPFYAEIKHLLPKENRVVIHEKMPSKENKQERIDVENHLIGFFMVEDKKIEPSFVKEIVATSKTTFQESKKILDTSFRVGSSTSDEVTCEVVKIPLVCTMTTQILKYPARGLFCTHYQCFDLSYFISFISHTANPKWICPLCKIPCYIFRIDSILLAILEQFSQEKGTEVMFFKSGEFTVHSGDKLIQGKISNISDLPIQTQGKRVMEPAVQPEKKKKRAPIIPENVIALDE